MSILRRRSLLPPSLRAAAVEHMRTAVVTKTLYCSEALGTAAASGVVLSRLHLRVLNHLLACPCPGAYSSPEGGLVVGEPGAHYTTSMRTLHSYSECIAAPAAAAAAAAAAFTLELSPLTNACASRARVRACVLLVLVRVAGARACCWCSCVLLVLVRVGPSLRLLTQASPF
jgi:hypothetical protein